MKYFLTLTFWMISMTLWGSEVPDWCGPTDLEIAPGAERIYVANSDRSEIQIVETVFDRTIRRVSLPAPPTGLELSRDGNRLYVTCDPQVQSFLESAPVPGIENPVLISFDTNTFSVQFQIECGDGARSPVLSPDEKKIYLCAQYGNALEVVDLTEDGKASVSRKIPMSREPFECAVSPDGETLVVSNLLPNAPNADAYYIPGLVAVVNTRTWEVTWVELPNGGINVRGICISPDGRFAYVVHSMGSYMITTGQVVGGWMNMNAVSFIDLRTNKRTGTQSLDQLQFAAANPWGCEVSADGKWLVVTQAGTGDVSVVDRAAMHYHFEHGLFPIPAIGPTPDHADDLRLSQTRVFTSGFGPRAVRIGSELGGNGQLRTFAYVVNHFSDTIDRILLCESPQREGRTIFLRENERRVCENLERAGERLFHDGTLCREQWQSCATCHPEGRTDALNWDLLNDGVGNSKNTKSLVLSHVTPPAMVTGVREKAELAVRKGIEMILFTEPRESDAVAIDAYLMALRPRRAPILREAERFSEIERGRKLFHSPRLGCAVCHRDSSYFLDGRTHDVGTGTGYENRPFDTPTLLECWRTAPYLHDGRYLTLFELFRVGNHGNCAPLTDEQIRDLESYILSL